MKRQYSKPDILFEDFSLSTAISGTCEVKTNTPSKESCGYDVEGTTVFLTGINGCVFPIEDGSVNDGLCYHVPVDTNNLFNS